MHYFSTLMAAVLCIIPCIILSPPALSEIERGATKVNHGNNKIANPDLSGALIDHSSSIIATDFVQGFAQVWRNYPFLQKYTIVLKETVDPLRGSSMAILNDRQTIYRTSLNRRSDNFGNGKEAAETVLKMLKQQARRPTTMDFDLAEDEI